MTACKLTTIVINTLNRASLLRNTLESFRHLDHDNFEVVVVNGPSTDGTQALLDEWKGRIRAGSCPEANLSMSRNIGIAMAKGDFVAFIDDDAIPESEWLRQAVAAFDAPEVAATGGKVFDHTGYSYQYQYATANRLGNGKWQRTQATPEFCFPFSFEFPYLQGTNTVFRRESLLQIGGFDEEFIYYLDETEVCLRLIDQGYIVRQLPNAYVHHKYAASHIREKGVAKYRYPVLKSKVYFSNRHAKYFRSQQEIDADNRGFFQNHRTDVQNHVNAGNLTEKDREAFEEQAERAWKLGTAAAVRAPCLLTTEALERYAKDPFLRFDTVTASRGALTIVLLCEDYPPDLLGGIARFTQDKAVALADLGHRVHVIARSKIHSTVDFEQGVWVHRIAVTPQPKSTEAAALDVPQSHWDQSASFLQEIDRIATHHAIDIVEAPIWNVVGIAPLLTTRYRVVTTLMTTLKLSLPSRPDLTSDKVHYDTFVAPLVAIEGHMLTHSHRLLGISNGIVNDIRAAYELELPSSQVRVSALGMPDWRKLTAGGDPAGRAWADGVTHVLFVGRLEKRKGIDLLLRAVPNITKQFPNVHFHIVGDDSIVIENGKTYRDLFESALKSSKQPVTFYGKASESDLRSFYRDCDVFVAPSRFESFGLIYVEAMMYRKPSIGADVGGIPEVVDHGVTGLLSAPGDADALGQNILRLLRDRKLREQMGDDARKRYEKLFTDRAMAENSLSIYRELVSELEMVR